MLIALMTLEGIPLLRTAAVRPFLRTMQRLGIPIGLYAERAGIPLGALAFAEGFLPHRQVAHFIGAVAYGEGRPDLGLIAGGSARLDDLGTFGTGLRGAITVGEALELGLMLQDAFSSGERWTMERRHGTVLLARRFLYPLGARDEPADHYSLAIAASIVRCGDGLSTWSPSDVRWQSRPSPAVHTSQLFRGASCRFGQPETSMVIHESVLSRRLDSTRGDRAALDLETWHASPPPTDLAGALREVIFAVTPPDDLPRIARTAHALGMTVRTLQRQLRNRGLSFERLVQESHLETATHLLRHTTTSILDIALDLGYSDHAHFTRAFRGWTGVSPREFRRRCAGGAPAVCTDHSRAFAAARSAS